MYVQARRTHAGCVAWLWWGAAGGYSMVVRCPWILGYVKSSLHAFVRRGGLGARAECCVVKEEDWHYSYVYTMLMCCFVLRVHAPEDPLCWPLPAWCLHFVFFVFFVSRKETASLTQATSTPRRLTPSSLPPDAYSVCVQLDNAPGGLRWSFGSRTIACEKSAWERLEAEPKNQK